MSMYKKFYIGVYIECKNHMVTVNVAKHGCVNDRCKVFHEPRNGEYCQHCGKPQAVFTDKEQVEAVDKWQVVDEIDQVFMPASLDGWDAHGINIWQPNFSEPETGIEHDEYSDNDVVELPPDTMQRHMRNFEDEPEFTDALDGLRKAYGPDNVTVKWGIVVDTV